MCIRDSEYTKALHSTTESTFANHTYRNIDNNMDILHVHTRGRKLDTLEQLEIDKHTKTHKNDILNEQTQFKSHGLFEHITPHTHLSLIHILYGHRITLSTNFICIFHYLLATY